MDGLKLASLDDLVGEILLRCAAQDGLFVCAYGTPSSGGIEYRVVGDPFAAIGHMIHMTDSLRAKISNGDDDDDFDLDERGNPVPAS